MVRQPLRIATTTQLARSVREGGFEAFVFPNSDELDFNRSLQQRLTDGNSHRSFLEENRIDLVLDYNTAALTFVPNQAGDGVQLTPASLGIPYVACYLDPVTATMAQVPWDNHWQILESDSWIKWIWESGHSEELRKLGIPNIVTMPMAAANDDFDTSTPVSVDAGPVVAFMGHPATSWFRSNQGIAPSQLFAGLTAAAVHADMPDLPFHKIYYDLYGFDVPPGNADDPARRAAKASNYFNQKFVYNAYLAVKQRDRFARFLKLKLKDAFELVGDHWDTHYGLPHTPRIWDMKVLHQRMRDVPICLNLMKGNLETGLNVRHFEITAYGGFMLTYWTPELSSCFEIGEECDAFHDESELLAKIHYYLENPDKRRDIACAGQQRTLRDHLYSHRITSLVHVLQQNNALPVRTLTQPVAVTV